MSDKANRAGINDSQPDSVFNPDGSVPEFNPEGYLEALRKITSERDSLQARLNTAVQELESLSAIRPMLATMQTVRNIAGAQRMAYETPVLSVTSAENHMQARMEVHVNFRPTNVAVAFDPQEVSRMRVLDKAHFIKALAEDIAGHIFEAMNQRTEVHVRGLPKLEEAISSVPYDELRSYDAAGRPYIPNPMLPRKGK